MAVVISSEERNYFSSSSLRRSHSGNFPPTRSSYSNLAKARIDAAYDAAYDVVLSAANSPRSSGPSSPRTVQADSTAPSFSSTPASSLSLNNYNVENDEDQIVFPSYDDVGYYDHVEDLEPPASPRGTGGSFTVSSTSNSTSTNISRADSPEPVEHAEDDTAIRTQPSRHVDYLSHNWREEDIWSSWKHIVATKGQYSNSARLENASWRTWMKSKNKLRTVTPETLGWLKDCDVTWLYGPLLGSATLKIHDSASPGESDRIYKSGSFLQKKPILKKRSMSEIMLQRSLSTSSLVKQAAAAVQAQQLERRSSRPSLGRASSDYATFPFASRRRSRENTSVFPSISSSEIASPTSEKKHIHFNEQVEQCIAVEVKGEDDDEIEIAVDDDSDSDDGGIMMKRSNSKRKLPLPSRKEPASRKNSVSTESRTIAMLPSTTLKYRKDTPEPQETAMKHSNGFWSLGKLSLSLSPSQETLRPLKSSTRILLGDDEDEDPDVDWQPPNNFYGRTDDMLSPQDRTQMLHASGNSSSLNGEPSGMRRTPSGMFMPYEDEDERAVSDGLFGRVVDTVNTARDIAHVIWNVGWRR